MRIIRHLTALVATLLVAAALPALAGAAPAVDGEFALTGQPGQLTKGPDGNVWVTLSSSTANNDIAKVEPNGTVTEYDLAAAVANPVGITTGPDGNLWVTKSGGVAKVPPANPTAAEAFPVASIADPRAITTGPDGNLWTASGDKVVKIPPAAPAGFTAYPVAGLGARGIAAGGDGNLWVVDFAGGRILSVTTAGAVTPYAVGGGPQEVTAGPGNQIAYTNPGATIHNVGRIAPGGTAATTDTPGSDPFGIALGADGAYWFAQFATNGVSRMTTDGQVTPLSGLSAGSGPRFIAAGAGNTLWVSLQTTNKIARITGVEAPAPTTGGGTTTGGETTTGGGTPTGGGTDTAKPVITGLAAPKSLRAGRSAKLRFTLSEAAKAKIAFARVLPGKRSGSKCVKPSARLAKARGCTRYASAGTLALDGLQGANSMALTGRVGKRLLAPGGYRLTVVAADAAGNSARSKTVAFTVLAAKG